MTFAVAVVVACLLVGAEAVAVVRAARALRVLRHRAPVDPVTGLRTGAVLYGLLVTMWGRADREGGRVLVDVVTVDRQRADELGLRLARSVAPSLHVLRVAADRYVVAQWLRPPATEADAGLEVVLAAPGLAARRMDSAEHQVSSVVAAAQRVRAGDAQPAGGGPT